MWMLGREMGVGIMGSMMPNLYAKSRVRTFLRFQKASADTQKLFVG
jgi:hypothetical protein